MVTKSLPGSFTKQFGLRKDPERLYRSIHNGFWKGEEPVTRDGWRAHCGLNDSNLDLIPTGFFLYSRQYPKNDYVLVDTLVEFVLERPYDKQFAKLAVFDFHLANSGNWRGSDWPDGRVAGWANMLIRDFAWQSGNWSDSAFEKQSLMSFLQRHVEGTSTTIRKIRNNYRFMLERAEILVDGKIQPTDFTTAWAISAPQLFWDRQIFDGKLRSTSPQAEYESQFLKHEIYKLLNCSREQGLAVAKSAFREFVKRRMAKRFKQLNSLENAAA
jgi:hypothetical protein